MRNGMRLAPFPPQRWQDRELSEGHGDRKNNQKLKLQMQRNRGNEGCRGKPIFKGMSADFKLLRLPVALSTLLTPFQSFCFLCIPRCLASSAFQGFIFINS